MISQRANDGKKFLKNVIIGHETWVYDYEIETKQQSSHWNSPASPCPKKARQVHLLVKGMPLFFSFSFFLSLSFFNIYIYHRGIVQHEFASEGQTIKICILWF
jgi:hypothetical protein